MADEKDQVKPEGNTPPDSSVAPWGDKFKSPEEVWQAYQAAEAERDAYKQYGTADQVKEVYDWGRKMAADLQAGRLKAAEAEAKKQEATPTEGGDFDFPDNFDELTPSQQARHMTKMLKAQQEATLKAMVEPLAKQYGEQISNYQKQTEQEKSLLFRVMEAKLANPKLNMQDALVQATKLQSLTPDQLLEMAINQATSVPDKAAIDAQVSKLVAEKLQEAENKRLEAAFGITDRKPRLGLGKNPRNRNDENREIMKAWRDAGHGNTF